jgi:hypothetical protein
MVPARRADRLLLDVACQSSAVGYSVLIELNDEERALYAARGRPYLLELAEAVSLSAPHVGDSRSTYGARDISRRAGMEAEVLAAVRAWRRGTE